jgi:hypothetical protein
MIYFNVEKPFYKTISSQEWIIALHVILSHLVVDLHLIFISTYETSMCFPISQQLDGGPCETICTCGGYSQDHL